MKPSTYAEFWPVYLNAHRTPGNRFLHAVGTVSGASLLLAGAALRRWDLALAAPVAGYAFAWAGHFGVEGNRPATFGHPLWSLYSDFRMVGRMLRGVTPRA